MLIEDSRGKKSWTLTFCVIVIIITLPVIGLWMFGADVTQGESFKSIISLTEQLWLMTIGAFIAREVTDRLKDKIGKK